MSGVEGCSRALGGPHAEKVGPYCVRKSKKSKAAPQTKMVGLVTLVIAFVGFAGGVESQQPKKVSRIGYLSSGDAGVSPRV